VAVRSKATLGEGPRWDAAAGRLLWVDIEGRVLNLFEPGTGERREIPVDDRVSLGIPTTGGGVLLALGARLAVLDLADESLRTIATFPHGPAVRSNDGACDPAGRLWIGTVALDFAARAAALYRLVGGKLEPVVREATISNGIGWSPDGLRMYYVDSPTQRVDVFDYDVATGDVANRRAFVPIDADDGTPDGLAVDDEGGVWVALYGGSSVRRYGADGVLDHVVPVPASNVTSCCFGGADLRSLFITTAAQESDDELGGSVFVTDAGVSGPAAQPFPHVP
jgi:sugar lactone lactonase YvrE